MCVCVCETLSVCVYVYMCVRALCTDVRVLHLRVHEGRCGI